MKPFDQDAPAVLLLAGVGGCVDAVGFLTLGGLFVSHMSGNSAALGAYFGQGDWREGLPHLMAIPVFVAGLFLGYLLTVKSPTARSVASLLFVEATLLTVFVVALGVLGRPASGSLPYFLICLPPLLAMGLQNATLKKLGSATVHTTYVTGVLDSMCESSARAVLGVELPTTAGSDVRATAREAAIASAVVWFSYIFGALYGSAALLFLHIGSLLPAVGVLVYVAVRLLIVPRA
jgi:uncharacterized membrane protein YoaK (UPF0700 family)